MASAAYLFGERGHTSERMWSKASKSCCFLILLASFTAVPLVCGFEEKPFRREQYNFMSYYKVMTRTLYMLS